MLATSDRMHVVQTASRVHPEESKSGEGSDELKRLLHFVTLTLQLRHKKPRFLAKHNLICSFHDWFMDPKENNKRNWILPLLRITVRRCPCRAPRPCPTSHVFVHDGHDPLVDLFVPASSLFSSSLKLTLGSCTFDTYHVHYLLRC